MKDLQLFTDITRVQTSFARGLPSYHDHAQAQARIARTLADHLQIAKFRVESQNTFENVLEFGCGTGHLTRQLCNAFNIETLHLNDLVPDCATLAAPLAQSFVAGPIQDIELPRHLDLIASASTVQWIEDLPGLMHRLTDHLRPGGWLALSSFAPAHFPELATLGSGSAAPSYVTPTDWQAMLPRDIDIHHLAEAKDVMRFASPRDVLRHLRATGVNGKAEGRWTRARLNEFEDRYADLFGDGSTVSLTYAPVWLIARKRG